MTKNKIDRLKSAEMTAERSCVSRRYEIEEYTIMDKYEDINNLTQWLVDNKYICQTEIEDALPEIEDALEESDGFDAAKFLETHYDWSCDFKICDELNTWITKRMIILEK